MREKYGWMYVQTCCSASSHGGLCNMQYIISKINDHGGISYIQMHRKYVYVCVCVCGGGLLNKRIIDVSKHASSITIIGCESKTWKYQTIVVCRLVEVECYI